MRTYAALMADRQGAGKGSKRVRTDAVDVSMFSAHQVARLLALRIMYNLGHYAADDPLASHDDPPRIGGDAS